MDVSGIDWSLVGYVVSLGAGVLIGYAGKRKLRKAVKVLRLSADKTGRAAELLRDLSRSLEDGKVTPAEAMEIIDDIKSLLEDEE